MPFHAGPFCRKGLSFVGPFCRKGLRDPSRPATKRRLIDIEHVVVERMFALVVRLAVRLAAKVLPGREDLQNRRSGYIPTESIPAVMLPVVESSEHKSAHHFVKLQQHPHQQQRGLSRRRL